MREFETMTGVNIDADFIFSLMLNKEKSDVINLKDIQSTCVKYSIPENTELINDLHLFNNTKNFKKGKTLLLLILSYKQIVSYDTMLSFGLCGNGKSEKRNLSNAGFIFENIGTGLKKDLKCTGFDPNHIVNRNIFSIDIKNYFKTIPQKCVMCGSSSNLEIDHKKPINRLDFLPTDDNSDHSSYQLLCNRCNTLKRQRCIKCVETDIIENRPDIISLCPNIKTKYDGDCSGCYWYDYNLINNL